MNTPVLYNPASSSLHPSVGVYHHDDSRSQLYVMLNTRELVVNEANPERTPKAAIKLHYQMFDCTDVPENTAICDSSTYVNLVSVGKTQRLIVFPIEIKAEAGRRYFVMVQTTDLLRNNTIKQYLTVDKTSKQSAQNFRLTAINGTPMIGNTIRETDVFRIIYEREPISRIFISYMAAEAPIANSPLAAYPATDPLFVADSLWEQPYSPTTNFMFGYQGIYLVRTDTLSTEGLLLMNFGMSFPREDRTATLVEPLRYLLPAAEYDKLQEAGDPKNVMDKYWLSITGSTDKARMLIRVFYTRMSYANRYFTDTKEGWKTDRGMVYMVYGLPNKIDKTSETEIWEYTRTGNDPIRFIFARRPLPYCADRYILRRNSPQSTYWSQAVDSWRKGRVFNIKDIDDDE